VWSGPKLLYLTSTLKVFHKRQKVKLHRTKVVRRIKVASGERTNKEETE
jgi:hypothetical protein